MLDVLYLTFLGRVRLTRRKARVNDLERKALRAPARGEGGDQQIAPRDVAECSRGDVSDVISLVIAQADNHCNTRATTHPRRVQDATAGESAAEGSVVVGEKARLLEADDVCLLEQLFDVGDDVVATSKAV